MNIKINHGWKFIDGSVTRCDFTEGDALMLMPVKPETLKTLEEIQKLEFLRDVVIPFVKEREKEGKVNLDIERHSCGTPSCLLGWTEALFTKETGINRKKCMDEELTDLGLYFDEWCNLFGERLRAGTLDDRAEACTRIINRKLGEL